VGEEEECVSNKEVHAMIKVLIELFMMTQQSTDTTLEWVERSMAGIIDHVDTLETRLPQTNQDKLPNVLMRMTTTTTRRRRWMTRSPSTLHVHHHDGRTMMTSRCTKSFHALLVDQIGKVWEATLIVALINSMHVEMMILLLKLSLQFLPSMVCMILKLI
jgi:hypothetical protein